MKVTQYEDEQQRATLDLLAFAAHPDDVEIGMGGTLAKHQAAGMRIGICDLTMAELSSNGTPDGRQAEADAAARALGLHVRVNLQLPDRGLCDHASEQIDRMVDVIRRYRPRMVFAPYWTDRHPDHVACSRMVEQAVFNAGLVRYRANGVADGAAHRVTSLYFYFIHELPHPHVVVDTSDFQSVKMAALEAYQSQFVHVAGSTVTTPLNQGYLEQVKARDRALGLQHRFQYAEGFVSKTPLVTHLFGQSDMR